MVGTLSGLALALLLLASAARAEGTLRIAAFDTGLARDWAGQLLWISAAIPTRGSPASSR